VTKAYLFAISVLGTLETGAAVDLVLRAFLPEQLRARVVNIEGAAGRMLREPPSEASRERCERPFFMFSFACDPRSSEPKPNPRPSTPTR